MTCPPFGAFHARREERWWSWRLAAAAQLVEVALDGGPILRELHRNALAFEGIAKVTFVELKEDLVLRQQLQYVGIQDCLLL